MTELKLIEQKILHCVEGASDKIYETEICEVSPDKYLVNFRFGRRGSALKEGTKTVSPVSISEAKKIFNELVNSKVKKGYHEIQGVPTTEVKQRQVIPVPKAEDNDPRKQAVLKRIAHKSGKWSLSRAIWKAGELKIKEATPLLLNHLENGNDLQKYCSIWSLGFCGDEQVIEPLRKIYLDEKSPEMLRRISCEALLKLSDEGTRKEFSDDLTENLPTELKEAVKTNDYELLLHSLQVYLAGGNYKRFSILDTLYLLDLPVIRNALLEIIRTAPLRPGYFQRLRHIFKASEYRRDAEVFGILSKRFEKEPAFFRNNSYYFNSVWGYTYINGEYTKSSDIKKELKKPESKAAYSSRTRRYLRDRVSHTLRRMGEINDPDFVKMAVGILLQYKDADAAEPKEISKSTYDYKTRRYNTHTNYWDSYAGYLPFNYILYSNSKRYGKKKGTIAWRCVPPFKPGDPEPSKREEAFPKLWEKNPAGLIHLLAESECHPVHRFAVKALKECNEILSEIDNETIIIFLEKPYIETVQFAFELAYKNYNPSEPDIPLIKALAECISEEARKQACKWISEQKAYFSENFDLLVFLLTSKYADTRSFAMNIITSAILSENNTKVLIAKIISHLLALSDQESDKAKDISDILLKVFPAYLYTINLNVVSDLLRHPLCEVQELAGNILLNHQYKPGNIPELHLQYLIKSDFESVRALGVKLISQLHDETVILKISLLVSLATHKLSDLRQAVRPLIARYSSSNRQFGTLFSSYLHVNLFKKEEYEGVHAYVISMLQTELKEYLGEITQNIALQFVKSKSRLAQDFGGKIFGRDENLKWANEMEILEIVRMANHEMLSIRNASWKMLEKIFEKHTEDKNISKLIRFFDSKWEDSREFAKSHFSKYLTDPEWTPGLLTGLCDSIYDDVRKFGKDMIMKYFRSEHGLEYLTKLSEHPSEDMQFFATSYLESYASGQSDKIKELMPYFRRVLSNVNKARISKDRIFMFLESEAEKNIISAEMISGLLSWYSATVAVQDKARTIEILMKIHSKYPDISVPLKIKVPEVRYAV